MENENEVQHSVLGVLAAARAQVDDLIAVEKDWEERKKLIDLSGHIAYVSGYVVSLMRARSEYLELLYPSPAQRGSSVPEQRMQYCKLLAALFAADQKNDQVKFDSLLPAGESEAEKMGRVFDRDFDKIYTKPRKVQQWCAIQHILWPCRGRKVDKVSLG